MHFLIFIIAAALVIWAVVSALDWLSRVASNAKHRVRNAFDPHVRAQKQLVRLERGVELERKRLDERDESARQRIISLGIDKLALEALAFIQHVERGGARSFRYKGNTLDFGSQGVARIDARNYTAEGRRREIILNGRKIFISSATGCDSTPDDLVRYSLFEISIDSGSAATLVFFDGDKWNLSPRLVRVTKFINHPSLLETLKKLSQIYLGCVKTVAADNSLRELKERKRGEDQNFRF
jgi:hypothetical protein